MNFFSMFFTRSPNHPLPEWTEERKKELIAQTVYVKGFDKEASTLDKLIAFFNDYESVINVTMRHYIDKKDNKKKFKVNSAKQISSRQKRLRIALCHSPLGFCDFTSCVAFLPNANT